MTVQAPEEDLPAVEKELIGLEFGGAEAELVLRRVQNPALFVQQAHPAGVAHRRIQFPGLRRRINQSVIRAAVALGQHNPAIFINQLRPVAAALRRFCRNLNLQCHQIRGGQVNVLNVLFRLAFQPDLPVNAAVGQVVDDKTEGRHRRIFRGVQLHGDDIVLTIADMVGDIHPEGGIAAAVGIQLLAVDIHGGNMGSAVEPDKVPLTPEGFVKHDGMPVAADHLIAFMVGIVQGHFLHVVRDPHLLTGSFTQRKTVKPFRGKLPLGCTKAELHGIVLLMFHF